MVLTLIIISLGLQIIYGICSLGKVLLLRVSGAVDKMNTDKEPKKKEPDTDDEFSGKYILYIIYFYSIIQILEVHIKVKK